MDLQAFNPFSPQFEAYQTPAPSFTQLITHREINDVLIPPQQQQEQDNLLDDDDNLLLQIPAYFTEDADLYLRSEDNDTSAQLRRKASPLHLDRDESNETNPKKNDGKKKQKVVHGEIERQRRSEMSSLHASLRSLLPLEYIKGKRAMSDHLGEAVKYINHLQQNLKALDDRRNTLKKEVCVSNNNKNSKTNDRDFRVKLCKGGVDVTVSITSCRVEGDDQNVDCGDEGLPLSKVLQCLIQEGLDVVSCISQRVEGTSSKLVHSIHAQVEDGINIEIDALKLQQKLKDL